MGFNFVVCRVPRKYLTNENIHVYGIHVLYTIYMYVNDNYFLSLGYAKRSLQDPSSILYRPITGKIDAVHDEFDWEELFTNNRFRKLYQRLADSKNRYSHFHESFALHMKDIFDLMKDAYRDFERKELS